MYINNVTKKPINDISFEGYWFSIPAGVSLVWDKFGEFIVNLYKADGSGGIPPVITATAEQWDGRNYADVRRFEINAEHIPNRNELLKIAKARGIDAETIEQWKEDETVEPREIANAINKLAVADSIRFPEPGPVAAKPQTKAEKAAAAAAEEALRDAGTGAAPQAPAAPTVPKTGNAAAPKPKTERKAAPKAPATPKAPKGGKGAKAPAAPAAA